MLQTNPAMRMGKYLRSKKDRREVLAPLTSEELSVLLRTVRKHYKKHFPLFLLLARTGLRIGEALTLKWEDRIDPLACLLPSPGRRVSRWVDI